MLGPHWARGIGGSRFRSLADYVRANLEGVLFRGARPHATQPAGARYRDAISFRDFLYVGRPEENQRSVREAIGLGQSIWPAHRHANRSTRGFLSRRGLPPGLHGPASREYVHRDQRLSESGKPAQALPVAVCPEKIS